MSSHSVRFSIPAFLSALFLALALAGCGGGGSEEEDAAPTAAEQAATLVSSGKAGVTNILTSEDPVSATTVLSTIQKFESAYGLDSSNAEARFYSGLLQLFIFLDGTTTTDLLGKLGLNRLRTELDSCFEYTNPDDCPPADQPFASDPPPIVGGTDSYVDLTIAEALGYAFGDLPAAIEAGAARLEGLPTTFTSQLSVPSDTGTGTQVVTFDFTDAQAVAALAHVEAAAIRLPTLFTTTDADAFLSANSTRDPDTGDFIHPDDPTGADPVTYPPDDISDVELYDWFNNGVLAADGGTETTPLQSNATGLAAVADNFATAFSNLAAAIGNLVDGTAAGVLANGDDGQPSYDAQEQIDTFTFGLLEPTATTLSSRFSSPTAGSLTIYEPTAFIVNWDVCHPVASSPGSTETFTNLNPFGEGGNLPPVADISGVAQTVTPNSATGVVPGTPHSDGAYYFAVTVNPATDLSDPGGISFFSRSGETVTDDIWVTATLGYDDGVGGDVPAVASDRRHGANGNFGISLARAYFGSVETGLPNAQVTLYLRVYASTADFEVYAWTDSMAGVPIFLEGGGGRNFEVALYGRTGDVSFRSFLTAISSVFDNADRTSLVLDDPGTVQDESTLEYDLNTLNNQVATFLPGVTMNAFQPDGTPQTTVWNVPQDNLEPGSPISFETPQTVSPPSGVTVPYALGGGTTFCAYPHEFGVSDFTEGGFNLF